MDAFEYRMTLLGDRTNRDVIEEAKAANLDVASWLYDARLEALAQCRTTDERRGLEDGAASFHTPLLNEILAEDK